MKLYKPTLTDPDSKIMGFDIKNMTSLELKRELVAHKKALKKCRRSKSKCEVAYLEDIKGIESGVGEVDAIGNIIEPDPDELNPEIEDRSSKDKTGKYILLGALALMAYQAYRNYNQAAQMPGV